MPYDGDFTQILYAQTMIDHYIEAEVPPEDVYPQSFLWADIYYWLEETDYGGQAVALDELQYCKPQKTCPEEGDDEAWDRYFEPLLERGVAIVARAQEDMVRPGKGGVRFEPSDYANAANRAGIGMITWAFEEEAAHNDVNKYELLDVLVQEVGIIGAFSDWPATVTFYANCKSIALYCAFKEAEASVEGQPQQRRHFLPCQHN
jgi:glycerophosphoryl diester phosphodiesterase